MGGDVLAGDEGLAGHADDVAAGDVVGDVDGIGGPEAPGGGGADAGGVEGDDTSDIVTRAGVLAAIHWASASPRLWPTMWRCRRRRRG